MTEKNKEIGVYSARILFQNELRDQEYWYEKWKTTAEGASLPGKELQINELKEGIKLLREHENKTKPVEAKEKGE